MTGFTGAWDTLVTLATAFLLGGAVGLEREISLHTAGLRTNVLVAVGSAFFVNTAYWYFEQHGGPPNALQVIAYVISGIGFLGAGVILREGGTVKGLNTAATIWCTGAIGAAVGAHLPFEALVGTGFIVAANTVLRFVSKRISRKGVKSL